MAAAIVQQASGNSGAGTADTYDVTLPSDTAADNQLVIIVSSDATVATPSGFTLDRSQVNNNGHYHFRKVSVAETASWTIDPGGSSSTSWWVAEISGLEASPVDQVNSAGSGTQQSSRSTESVTTTVADTLLIGSVGGSSSTAGRPVAIVSWTNSFVEEDWTVSTKSSGTDVSIGVAVRTVSSTGSYSSTASWTGDCATAGMIVAYKIAAGGTPGSASPAAIARSFTVDAASPAAAGNVSPGAIARVFTVDAPTPFGPGNISPAVVARLFTVDAATPFGTTTVRPGVIARVFTVDAATPVGQAVAAPAAIVRVFTVDDATPTNSDGTTVEPATIARVFTVDAATPVGLAVAAPGVIARVFTVDAVTPVGSAVALPATTARSFTVDAATPFGTTTVRPGVIARSFTVDAVTIDAAGNISPAALVIVLTIPQVTLLVVVGQVHPDAPLFAVLVSSPALAELTERGFSVADLDETGSVADLDETKTSA